uniref:Fatty acyl-CoA reductase n=1 Tax=Cacopsylla melanoneura TaxID=428564 RepID=A0A8D8UBE4_9HEMI
MDFYNRRDYLDETELESKGISEIQTFYANKTIFITGASGFVGTLVLEKLLRTCKDLRKVYVLFRSSKRKNIQERLVEYFNDPVFERMKSENPTYYTQVTCIQGDLSLDQLGLLTEDRKTIVDNTQIILHVAATVKFDEHLADAYNINVKGTKTMIQLAELMKQLQSFVYVSTAYSNCDRKHIEEKFYDPVFSDEETITMLQHSERHELALLLPHILDRKPNTYTFTKTIAEDLVRESSGHLPVVVVRPSVIMPTLKEPFPYYSNDKNSVLSIAVGAGVGLLRVLSCANDNRLDMIPGDMTVNCIIAASWNRAVTPHSPLVYNCVSVDSPGFLRELMTANLRNLTEAKEILSDQMMWLPHLIIVENTFCLYFLYYILHLLPGLFFSLAEQYFDRKPMIMKIYRKLFFLSKTVRYFMFNNWSFTNDNTKSLLFQLNARDRELFDFNMASFDWTNYYSVLYRCIAIYVLKAYTNKENFYPKEMYKRKMKYIEPIDITIRWTFRLALVYLSYNMLCAVAV